VNVEYSLAPEYKFPCNHDDALCAVQWVKNHRKDLGKYSIKISQIKSELL
jgi:acetyl esterase/lipase